MTSSSASAMSWDSAKSEGTTCEWTEAKALYPLRRFIQLWPAKLSRRPTPGTLVTLGIVISTFSINQSVRSHDNEKVKEECNALRVLVLKNKKEIGDVESRFNLAEEKLISVVKELEVEKEKLEKLEKEKLEKKK
ncbi:hypothetical protein Bca4012_086471 [Brassica carinata]